ncbi:hypothetical protein Tco_1077437 [Tanacetum coccineum]
MMSDHNSSDLAPQRQMVSAKNNTSGPVPQSEKPDSSHQGLEFLFNPLLEEYYNPTHGQAEENNNDQAPNASFQEAEFVNPFCTRVQEIGESSLTHIDKTQMVQSFQPQSHHFRWTKIIPFRTSFVESNQALKQERQLTTDPEMCMFAATGENVEPKTLRRQLLILHRSKQCSYAQHWKQFRFFVAHVAHKSFPSIRWTVKTAIFYGPLKEEVYRCSPGKEHFWRDTVPGDKLVNLDVKETKLHCNVLQQNAE